MIGTTLEDLRERIKALASDDGDYYLVCARYGDRPVPAAGLRFETRAKARAAALGTEQYRAALRRYDPRVPCYDVIVCQECRNGGDAERATAGESLEATAASDDREHDRCPDRESVFGQPADATACGRSSRVEYCHRIAAAVFEALSERGHDDVESAVMDAYFELAESVPDPDNLCLCLLESIAGELHRRLAPNEQADVVRSVAFRLSASGPAERPVAATLASLERHGLVDAYDRSPDTGQAGSDGRDVVVHLSGYALSPRGGRLPVLPIVVELARHRPSGDVASVDVVDAGDGWRLRVNQESNSSREGVASAPFRPEN